MEKILPKVKLYVIDSQGGRVPRQPAGHHALRAPPGKGRCSECAAVCASAAAPAPLGLKRAAYPSTQVTRVARPGQIVSSSPNSTSTRPSRPTRQPWLATYVDPGDQPLARSHERRYAAVAAAAPGLPARLQPARTERTSMSDCVPRRREPNTVTPTTPGGVRARIRARSGWSWRAIGSGQLQRNPRHADVDGSASRARCPHSIPSAASEPR